MFAFSGMLSLRAAYFVAGSKISQQRACPDKELLKTDFPQTNPNQNNKNQ